MVSSSVGRAGAVLVRNGANAPSTTDGVSDRNVKARSNSTNEPIRPLGSSAGHLSATLFVDVSVRTARRRTTSRRPGPRRPPRVETDREYVVLSLEANELWRNDAPQHFFTLPVGATD